MTYLLVRRGLDPSYYEFLKFFAAERRLGIVLDRREGDRRKPSMAQTLRERRRQERRGSPPATWHSGDFVLVRRPDRNETVPDEHPA